MNAATHPAARALWYIENNFNRQIDLDDIARAAQVSRFHLARVFDARMGQPVMAYVRNRRLSEAARRLAAGAPDILAVALDSGYGSHEAFTRAFRDLFATTPETVRDRGSVAGLNLQEAILMDKASIDKPSPHHIEAGYARLVAGYSRRFTLASRSAIPALWQAFVPHLGHIAAQTGPAHTTYGVCYNPDEAGDFDYMCGVEVRPGADLPEGFSTLALEARTYAVFPHEGHISGLRATWDTIWSKWIPENGLKVVPAPFFELYGPSFDPNGNGGLDIWIPVENPTAK
ncbi:MAG: AraC family transcriptional regulator [Asticcacaulis sp.]|nr:AraC family transcriptional regulator [Asticcacaulis sp.]